jgi:hypothetical protein
MYRAGMNDLMAKVFLDLRFIENKLKITGPADLITDLVKYSTNIIGENNEVSILLRPFQYGNNATDHAYFHVLLH